MIPGLWRCASRPWLDALGFLVHPVGLLFLFAAWGVLAAFGFRRASSLIYKVLVVLGLEALVLTVVLAIVAAIVSALGGNPTGPVDVAQYLAIVVSWATALWIVGRTMRRWKAGGLVEPTPLEHGPPRRSMRGRLVVSFLAVIGIVHVVVPRNSPLIQRNPAYGLALYLFDRNTMGIASDECLASRVIDYHSAARREPPSREHLHGDFAPDLSRYLVKEPGDMANNILSKRGDSRFKGVLRILSEVLERGDPDEQAVALNMLRWATYRLGAHPVVVEWAASSRKPVGQLLAREWLGCVRANRREMMFKLVDERCNPRERRVCRDAWCTGLWE